jgi:hypothetical protein
MSCGKCGNGVIGDNTPAVKTAEQQQRDAEIVKKADLLTQIFIATYWCPDGVFKTKDRIVVQDTCRDRKGRDHYEVALYLTPDGWLVEESIWENFYDTADGYARTPAFGNDPTKGVATRTNTFKSATFAPILERKSVFHWHKDDEVIPSLARVLDRLVNDLKKATLSVSLASDLIYTMSGREGRCDSPMMYAGPRAPGLWRCG